MSDFSTETLWIIETLGVFHAVVGVERITFAAYTVTEDSEGEIIATSKDGAVILLGNGGHFTLEGDEIVFTPSQDKVRLEVQDKVLVEVGDTVSESNWGLFDQYMTLEGELADSIEDVA